MTTRLTKAMAKALRFILVNGPGTLPANACGRITPAVSQCLDAGLLETLNRLRPGPAMYEITPAGRQALQEGKEE